MSFNVGVTEGCGICLKPRPNVEWYGTHSKYAHADCCNAILPAAKNLYSYIENAGANPHKKIRAHIAAVHAVERACGGSIMRFLKRNGEGPLAQFFNEVGMKAAAQILVLPDSKI